MTTAKQRIAQQWPRVTVGLYAAWGLTFGLYILLFSSQLNILDVKSSSIRFSEFRSSPEEEEHIAKLVLVIMGTVMVITNGIALYASIRKSVWATKVSLVVWIAQISYLFLFAAVFLVVFLTMPDGDRRQLPHLSPLDWIRTIMDFGLTSFHGWALLVLLRDLTHRQRDVWGRLVRTGGVFEYEPVGTAGPVHL